MIRIIKYDFAVYTNTSQDVKKFNNIHIFNVVQYGKNVASMVNVRVTFLGIK